MPLGITNLEVEFQLCWLFSSSWDAPKCTASWPSLKQPGPGEANRGPPGGPYQYCAVHQYSVVRRVWGASGVYMFLFFAPPTPPQNLVAALLSTPVRCTRWLYIKPLSYWPHQYIGNAALLLFKYDCCSLLGHLRLGRPVSTLEQVISQCHIVLMG